MRVDKYNTPWQIVRVKARKVKDPRDKIKLAVDFLKAMPTRANFERVMNWIEMTALGYKGRLEADFFTHATQWLKARETAYTRTDDPDQSLSGLDAPTLISLYKDLSKRKYGFRFANAPKSHLRYMDRLRAEMRKRDLL